MPESNNGDANGLTAASKDAGQNFSSTPVGAQTQACGSGPASGLVISPQKKDWVQIEMVDAEGNPVAGEDYRITLPDGSAVEGSLDANGQARVDGIDPGTCQVTFPNLDQTVWCPQ